MVEPVSLRRCFFRHMCDYGPWQCGTGMQMLGHPLGFAQLFVVSWHWTFASDFVSLDTGSPNLRTNRRDLLCLDGRCLDM